MLRLENISKTYNKGRGNAVGAVKNVTLDFPEKGMVFVVGKSGCGKTTLLNIIGKIDEPDNGRLVVDEQYTFDKNEADNYRNRYVGFIFQEFNLLSDFTVAENIRLARSINHEDASDEEIEEILSKVGLSGYGGRKTNQLSGGEQQRVAIARALIKNSRIILADEPTGSLDSKSGEIVMDILKQISKDKLVIIISHDLKSAEKYCDRLIRMNDGVVINDSIKDENGEMKSVFDKINLPEERIKAAWKIEEEKDSPGASDAAKEGQKPAGKQEKKAKLPASALLKLAVSKIKKHYVKFIVSVCLIVVSLSVVGISTTFSSYDMAEESVTNLNRFGETSVGVYRGEPLGGFGFVDREARLFRQEDVEYVAESRFVDDYDNIYLTQGTPLRLSEIETNLDRMPNTVMYYYESSAENLANYGFNIKPGHGEFPKSAERDENGFIHIALTDYYAYLIKHFGAMLADGTGIKGVEPQDLLGLAISFVSESFVIDAIIDTGFEKYIDIVYTTGDETGGFSDVEVRNYSFMMENYYRSLYFAKGVHEKLYAKKFYKAPSMILTKEYFDELYAADKTENGESAASIVWMRGQSSLKRAEDVLVSEKIFYSTFGHELTTSNNNRTYSYTLVLKRDGVDTYFEKEYRIVGVIKNASKANYDSNEVVVMTDGAFNFFANESAILIGLHVKLPESDADKKEFIYYLEDNYFFYAGTMSWPIYSVFNTINNYKTLFTLFSVVLSVISMMFIADFMVSAIKDRQNEIGVLRAMGVSGGDISLIFLIQAGIIFVLGVLLATAALCGLIALVNSILMNTFMDLSKSVSILNFLPFAPKPFFIMYGIMFGVLALSAMLPILKLNAMKPIDNIRRL